MSPPTSALEPVIGLEIHAELLTHSKMFCGCPVVDLTAAGPNTAVCEICTGMPGTLPVLNRRAVEFALRVALALECDIAETSVFARKNYFYPDLPKGYQISQYELPLAGHGTLVISLPSGPKPIGIRRVHLEEDTGKLFHHAGYSLVDFNRSGVPLLEVVSEPDLHAVDEAYEFATSLRTLLRYLDVTSGDMERGVIRFEANVSLRPRGSSELGTRVEIKNLNSFRAMTRALTHEIERQTQVLSQGGSIIQETRGWDEGRGITVPQRGKEEAEDYRYFPEPDLPPLVISKAWVDEVRASLPELPVARRQRLAEQYGLSDYTAGVLIAERQVAEFFEKAVASAQHAQADKIANWLTGDLFALLNEAGMDLADSKLAPQALAEIVDLVEAGEINATSAKEVLGQAFSTGEPPGRIVEQRDLRLESDPQVLDRLVDRVIRENPDQVRDYLGGKTTISQWFFGQVMKASQGRADPQIVRRQLDRALRRLESDRASG